MSADARTTVDYSRVFHAEVDGSELTLQVWSEDAAGFDEEVRGYQLTQFLQRVLDGRAKEDAPGAQANRTVTAAAIKAVQAERAAQRAKWGEQRHDPMTWLAILGEEVGEANQAALHDMFGGFAAGTLRKELVQVAAVAVQMIEHLDAGTLCGKTIIERVAEMQADQPAREHLHTTTP